MKANILTTDRKKRRAKEMANKILDEESKKRCVKCCENLSNEFKKVSAINGQFYALQMALTLSLEFGFGAKRLCRLINAYNARKDRIYQDLKDGIAFTKMEKEFNKRKVYFEDEEIKAFRLIEKVNEEGVIYNPTIKEWRCANETE